MCRHRSAVQFSRYAEYESVYEMTEQIEFVMHMKAVRSLKFLHDRYGCLPMIVCETFSMVLLVSLFIPQDLIIYLINFILYGCFELFCDFLYATHKL